MKKPELAWVSPHDLIPYDRNSRTHPAWQIAQIIASIEEFGFANPILVGDDGVIIAGHGRLAAALQMGLEEVSVVRLGHLSEAQRRALVIADNKIAENAGWDEDMLRQELEALQAEAFDLDVLGFDMDELNAILDFDADDDSEPALPGEDDHVPEPDPVYASEAGDVWILGDHRLLCGDSTDPDAVAILCDGFLVDCVWTDPPYNVNYEGTAGKIQNDDMSAADFRKFLVSAFMAGASVMRPGAPIYVAHADTEGLAFRKAFVDAGLKLSGCLIWEKPSLVLGRSDYQWRHEPILYGWKPGAAHSWYGARDKTTVLNHDGEAIRLQSDGTIQVSIGDQVVIIEGENLSMRSVDTSIIRHDKPSRNPDHPTMKPVSLIERYLANSSKPGDLVLDLFGGSGSTLIACEKMGRKARLMELDPRFCDVIVNRWQEYTGKTAVLEADGRSFDQVRGHRVKVA
ncbi:site-specific DNA-methyltransferase [Leisingera daeponensis]|uniref:site-specific DNA-methyltransferase n=1 Tax=Leisingera daeponensis TaxID=405746 RepID=UPI001C937226|nr:site-specific DNA-methyltransferase [Leisingera daeponensis]MBY6055393.1 site-specific DNA-methyltransferase [Leisingera daeponensis]